MFESGFLLAAVCGLGLSQALLQHVRPRFASGFLQHVWPGFESGLLQHVRPRFASGFLQHVWPGFDSGFLQRV